MYCITRQLRVYVNNTIHACLDGAENIHDQEREQKPTDYSLNNLEPIWFSSD